MKQQKEDIEELASMFKDMLGKPDDDMDTPFVKELESHFVSTEDFAASYSFIIEGIKKPLHPESHGNPHLHRSYWSEYLRLPVYKKYNCRLSFFCLLKYKYLIEHTKRFKISFRCHLTRHKRSLECHPSVND